MIRDQVSFEEPCPRCGEVRQVTLGQHCFQYRTTFSAYFRCGSCGNVMFADGGELPDDVRRAFEESSGRWEVVREDDSPAWIPLAKLLLEVAELDHPGAVRLAKSRGVRLAAGTRVEMECLRSRIEALGMTAVVRRIG